MQCAESVTAQIQTHSSFKPPLWLVYLFLTVSEDSVCRRRPHSAGSGETRQMKAVNTAIGKGRKREAVSTQTGFPGSREGGEVCSNVFSYLQKTYFAILNLVF